MRVTQLEAQLKTAKQTLNEVTCLQSNTQRELKDLESRLSFSPELPTSVLLSIEGQLGKTAGERVACGSESGGLWWRRPRRWVCTIASCSLSLREPT